jgi:hypothetical protein
MIGGSCHPCCASSEYCCTAIALSGFQHPAPDESFTFARPQFSGRTDSYILQGPESPQPDGASLSVYVPSITTEAALVQVSTYSPIGYVTRSSAIQYRWIRYEYRYRKQSGISLPAALCNGSVITLDNSDITSISAQSMLGDNFTPALPTASGTARIGLGAVSVWNAANSGLTPRYLSGDKWNHNISQIVLEVSGEIVGNSTVPLSPRRDPAIPPETRTYHPLSYTFALTPESSGSSQLRTYSYSGTVSHAPYWTYLNNYEGSTSSAVSVSLRLYNDPSCQNGGRLMAQILQCDVPFAGFVSVISGGAPLYGVLKTNNPMGGPSDPTPEYPAVRAVQVHDSVGSNQSFQQTSLFDDVGVGYGIFPGNFQAGPQQFLTEIYDARERMRECPAAPCANGDVADTNAMGRIFATLPRDVSPTSAYALPNAWTTRVYYPQIYYNGPFSSWTYATIKLNARIVSVS